MKATKKSNSKNEQVIRELYRTAEVKDTKAFVKLFTDDGYFWDVSAGVKYYGADIGKTVDIYATAFPDMHRELIEFFVLDDENVVIVELTLNGTHNGPLALPAGSIPATKKVMSSPCCDMFYMENGKVKAFHCYNAGTIIFAQLGVLANLSAAMK
ncbi:MAG TPA: nuclear transport factor 2 family protein [Chryseolinea sp.]|nr:nuclear transport factor 2 family protein [Chryseolinea sp.]